MSCDNRPLTDGKKPKIPCTRELQKKICSFFLVTFLIAPYTRAFQTMLLGPLISMTGSRKMGLLLHKPNKDMGRMIELYEAGKVVPVINRLYALSETAEAMRYFAEGRKKGKVVITLEHENKSIKRDASVFK